MKVRRVLAAAGIAAVMLVPSAPAIAQYTGTTPPEVLPSDTAKTEVKGETQVRGVAVAVTGADVLGLLGIGGAAVAGGIVIRRTTRARGRA